MFLKFFTIPVIAEFLCLAAAIFLLKKRTTIWQLFIPFLVLTICIETTGWFLTFVVRSKGNGSVFNFNLIINVCFSVWMLVQADPMKRIKKKAYTIISIFVFVALINIIFFQGFYGYNSVTEVIGDILFIILSCYFFYSVLAESHYRNVFQYEYFWYSNGLLFYSLGAVVLFIYYSYIKTLRLAGWSGQVYRTINDILNILLYSSYIVAFICRNRNTKS